MLPTRRSEHTPHAEFPIAHECLRNRQVRVVDAGNAEDHPCEPQRKRRQREALAAEQRRVQILEPDARERQRLEFQVEAAHLGRHTLAREIGEPGIQVADRWSCRLWQQRIGDGAVVGPLQGFASLLRGDAIDGGPQCNLGFAIEDQIEVDQSRAIRPDVRGLWNVPQYACYCDIELVLQHDTAAQSLLRAEELPRSRLRQQHAARLGEWILRRAFGEGERQDIDQLRLRTRGPEIGVPTARADRHLPGVP